MHEPTPSDARERVLVAATTLFRHSQPPTNFLSMLHVEIPALSEECGQQLFVIFDQCILEPIYQTTHLLDEAERLCQRIGILKQGCLLVEGSFAQLRQYIPAQEIVLVQTSEEDKAIARARVLGLSHRRYDGTLAFWLPTALELKEIINRFDGIPLDCSPACWLGAYL